jgi:hypothetical protein
MLAEAVAARSGQPLAAAMTRHTNLVRRLLLETPPAWADYTARIAALPDVEARLAHTLEVFLAAPAEGPRPGQTSFGCFAHEPPDAAGAVRIHFNARDDTLRDATGPLARHKVGARKAELAAMVASVRQRFPEATTVRGGSWLYNLEAYCRLFPPAFLESRASPGTWQLGGTSTWGQLLDHTERVRPDVRASFVLRLATLDPAAPWEAFPLRALVTRAPLDVFLDFYRDAEA